MQVALVGLTQSGKSTLFTAVTAGGGHSEARTVDRAVVKVPDERLSVLAEVYQPKKVTHATVEFLDLPGLSFLDESARQEARRTIADARNADMLALVVRGFASDAVAAYKNRVDPADDMDELKNELLLADFELVANRIEKLDKAITKPTPQVENQKRERALLQRCSDAIESLQPISEAIKTPEEEKLLRSFGFLTMKPSVIVLNAEEGSGDSPAELSDAGASEVLTLCASLEAELAALDVQERRVFMEEMQVGELALDRLVGTCYKALDAITFLTVGPNEVRAWTVPVGCPAVEAAGEIHSDMQRGFIRAETVHYDDFVAAGDFKAAKAAGKVRLEGKAYPVKDGDIINFRFNV